MSLELNNRDNIAVSDSVLPHITISDSAAERIAKIIEQHPGTFGVRLQVDGGGCSGFQYSYSLAEKSEDDDFVLRNGNARLIVDAISAPFLENATVDFARELIGEAFKVINPNATSQCGCGVSFSM